MPDPQAHGPDDRSAPPDAFAAELFRRLRARRGVAQRYSVGGELGQGATGVVLRAHDEDLRRDLAMKVLRAERDSASARAGPASQSLRVARFLDEAQVTGQLDHPGIVPVHELGIDADERLFFTMKLVRGQTLKEIFEHARDGREGWSTTRALGVLLKICEAMAYAHQKRVIHRDLKPSNVMVGRFGEVFVMDWGLARLLDRPEQRDIRIREPEASTTLQVESERRGSDSDPGSPLCTMDGDVVGTPAYMSPEQAHGSLDRIGPQTDVYSVGAILYHLLTGNMPYVTPATRVDNYAIWRWVREGPPAPLEVVAPDAPPELVAICNQAMERDLARRYASMQELADELRAYLEGRVVRAHRTGPWVELTKWVTRNKAVAALTLTLVAGLLVGGSTVIAKEIALRAETQLSLDTAEAARLLAEFEQLGPIAPANAPRMQRWLDQARRLLSHRSDYADELALLERAAGGFDEAPPAPEAVLAHSNALNYVGEWEEILQRKRELAAQTSASAEALQEARDAESVMPAEIEHWRSRAAALQASANVTRTARLGAPDDQRRYARVRSVVESLARLEEHALPVVTARIAEAQGLRARSVEGTNASRWRMAIERIASEESAWRYDRLRIVEQVGLIPLGENAQGLWEFWHVVSGAEPLLDETGRHVIGPETGIVLVLLPGGRVQLGAQATDVDDAHYDARASLTEATWQAELAPYFVSKYELTQGQWLRATGDLPSEHFSGHDNAWDRRITRAHPVEHVNFEECARTLALWGLQITTEAQWEHAARGGTHLPYLTSADPEGVRALANFGDERFTAALGTGRPIDAARDDCFAVHAPVGSFEPNGFGLHDLLGNVAEWCRDWYGDSGATFAVLPGDGERIPNRSTTKCYRGGSFKSALTSLRVSARQKRRPTERDDNLGVRPVRALDL